MCGIAGFYSLKRSFSQIDLELMTNTIRHRGPDAFGYFLENSVGLGHRRLSILDLSEKSNQPMHSSDGRFVISYNGEVYNFREIAKELNLSLKTGSDTEVILEAFLKLGDAFVHRCNGMFAIAIYDRLEDELWLFRDRLGIKPIYYYYNDNDLIFASELKAIYSLKQVPKIINPESVKYFLYLGFIPDPITIYKNTFKLKPGHYLRIKKTNIQTVCFWDAKEKINSTIISDEESAEKELDSLIKSSVKYRMISDVPLGSFLSGGIDSSLVTAVAQEISGTPIETFSLGFKEGYSETRYAKKVSEYLGTSHNEIIISEKDALNVLDKLTYIYDEPYADSSAIPTLLISEFARKKITVAIGGDGGDELFLGYGNYTIAAFLNKFLINKNRHFISFALKLLPGKFQRIGDLFSFYDNKQMNSHIVSQAHYYFTPAEISNLLTEKPDLLHNYKLTESHYPDLKRSLSPEEQQALFDLYHYLNNDLLTKVDKATMYHGLELRVPLLDYRIVEFSLNLSKDLKIKNGESKYLLKKILYKYIPKTYFEHKKWGFVAPLKKWMENDLDFLITTYLSLNTISQFNIVNYTSVERLIKLFRSGKHGYLYQRLWLLIVLHKWLTENIKNEDTHNR